MNLYTYLIIKHETNQTELLNKTLYVKVNVYHCFLNIFSHSIVEDEEVELNEFIHNNDHYFKKKRMIFSFIQLIEHK